MGGQPGRLVRVRGSRKVGGELERLERLGPAHHATGPVRRRLQRSRIALSKFNPSGNIGQAGILLTDRLRILPTQQVSGVVHRRGSQRARPRLLGGEDYDVHLQRRLLQARPRLLRQRDRPTGPGQDAADLRGNTQRQDGCGWHRRQ